MASTVSANLGEDLSKKARLIASRENRSLSNVVENAVAVFTDLPKDLRDALVELRSADRELFRDLNREMMAFVAKARFEKAATEAASALAPRGQPGNGSDLALLEEASALAAR